MIYYSFLPILSAFFFIDHISFFIVIFVFLFLIKIDIEQEKPLAKMTASFFSRLTFSWYSPLTYLGLKRPIILSDIWRIRRCDSSFYNYQLFQNKLEEFRQKHDDDMKKLHGNNPNDYNNETKRFKVNIIKVIWSTLKYYFIPGSLAKIFNDIFVFANPMVLKYVFFFDLFN